MTQGFKFVAADLTSRRRQFSYLDALRTGERVEATNIDPTNTGPCPSREGDGLCVAKTVRGACSGGQSASTAVGLLVEFEDVLGEDDNKVRVGWLTVTGVFDPVYLIRLGMCADLRHADLKGADLKGADLRDANLVDANLRGADLTGANLTGAYLRGADLKGANLRGAYLTGADLTGAYLTGANLRYANLRGADLRGAYLTGANLRYANLRGADLRGANLPTGFNVPKEAIR